MTSRRALLIERLSQLKAQFLLFFFDISLQETKKVTIFAAAH